MRRSNWIGEPWQDVLGILLPPFAALLLVACVNPMAEVDPLWWLFLIVFVDVAHVYSTLFRAYWARESRQKFGEKLWVIPLVCLVIGVMLHMWSPLWFWRLLAYAAVWHFVRQQYGFLRLYERNEVHLNWRRRLSALTIYTATVYPLLFWHLSGDRQFHWMVDGDFMSMKTASPFVLEVFRWLYFTVIAVYVTTEIRYALTKQLVNWPKNLFVFGTVISWYFGIIFFNGDMAFTALNVISHGVPYLMLVWLSDGARIIKGRQTWQGVIFFLGIVILLAWSEEALWDSLVWRDHAVFFKWLYPEQPIGDRTWLNLIVPLLALPQLVHYVLDGFIWRRKSLALPPPIKR
jgi:hypothetical protein